MAKTTTSRKTENQSEEQALFFGDSFNAGRMFMNEQSEKVAETYLEWSASLFQGSDLITRRLYENHVANMAASFEGMKALIKTGDVTDFVSVATSNMADASERLTEQTKDMMELGGKITRETGEAATNAFSKGFSSRGQ